MKRFSHIICFLLASVIALTAQNAALARTMPDAQGQMVLCTGSGPMLVHFDANGDPVDAPQVCPECTLSLITALSDDLVTFTAIGAWCAVATTPTAPRITHLDLPALQARGPPFQ